MSSDTEKDLHDKIAALKARLSEKDREIEKLTRSHIFLSTLLEGMSEEIMVIDRAYGIQDVNQAFLTRNGLEKQDVVGKKCYEVAYHEKRPCRFGGHICPLERSVQSGGRAEAIHRRQAKDGEIRKYVTVVYPLPWEGGSPEFFIEIARDVTEQKKLEKRALRSERLAAVGLTVAHVAHEIKNPLMIIGGFSHQIKKSLFDASALRKLNMVLGEVGRLERLVANLSDFTKEYKLMKRPADVGHMIRDVIKIMAEIYPQGIHDIVLSWPSHLPEIHCDPDKLKQVFMNVIANGIEAMTEGGVIRIHGSAFSGGLEIRIQDDGVGISEEDLLLIFEPFYTTRERGSGLGLCISYKIVQAHDGDIWAESVPGHGTTFVVRLPSK